MNKKPIDYKAKLTIHGADKMDGRQIKSIERWLAQIAKSLKTEAYSRTCTFKLMK